MLLSAKQKIYYWCNTQCGGQGDWHHARGLSEDGRFNESHICSHHGFMCFDIIERTDRTEKLNELYPDGWEAVFVENAGDMNDPLYKELIAVGDEIMKHNKENASGRETGNETEAGSQGSD